MTRLVIALALAAAVASVPRDAVGQRGTLVRATVHSRALEQNLLGDSPDRSVFVYLPANYETEPRRHFPVVVLLHGVGDNNLDWLNGQYQGLNLETALDSLIAVRAIEPMIVVLPDARNAYDGSFYTNSLVAGDWEDFISRDLVAYLDNTYRVGPHPAAWGLAGHSMGGYGALKLAMKHADRFSAVYALSPCCITWGGDLSADNPSWRRTLTLTTLDRSDDTAFYPKFFVSLATAWSPNPRRSPLRIDLPFRLADSAVRPAEPAYSAWAANLLLPLAGQFRPALARLRGIAIAYGDHEQFSHISLGATAFARFLEDSRIRHELHRFTGDHFSRVREQLVNVAFPYLSRTLSVADQH